jgi:phage terminase large subunit GpA-like protein
MNYLLDKILSLPDENIILQVSEWAEEKRYLPRELTPDPGFWRNDRTPYLKEIMDCFSESSPIREVAIMKGAQGGFTTGILENVIGYCMDCAPAPMMYVSADKSLAETGVEVRIDRMIQTVDGLVEKVRSQTPKKHAKSTGDTKTRKDFAGGFLMAIGARSPAKLRMMSIKNLLLDEVDGFPLEVGREGDPVSLAKQRTKNFASNRKIMYISTPLILQTSRINKLYEEGDKRQYYIPCPNCGEMQTLVFFVDKDTGAGIHYELNDKGILDVRSVYYQCKACEYKIKNAEKYKFLVKGEWRPEANHQPIDRTFRSYYWPSLLSPWHPWEELVKNWLSARGNIELMKSFRNTELGLPWEERGESPSLVAVMSHRRFYTSGTVPNKLSIKDTGGPILLLTAAIDTQDNGLFVEVCGWVEGGGSWSIDWRFLEGNTKDGKVWDELKDLLYNSEFQSDDFKTYQIQFAAIDAGGHRTKQVYEHCLSYGEMFLMPLMGERYIRGEGHRQAAWRLQKEKPNYPNLLVYDINTTWYKNELARKLKQEWQTNETQPIGYKNYPDNYGQDFFAQFTAESLHVEKDPKTGATRSMYWKASGKPNHAFDVAVYQDFALEVFAHNYCLAILGLEKLSWESFWEAAKSKIFFY